MVSCGARTSVQSRSAHRCDAGRSLRVAAALNARFGEIARPSTFDSPEALSNVLGEARQIYPAIWSNLDDAHVHLGALGKTVPQYIELRARPATRDAGVLEVNVTVHAQLEKTALINAEGYATALAAINALKSALPDVDWDSLERADARELAAAGSLVMARWKVMLLGLITVVVMSAVIGVVLYLRSTARETRSDRFDFKINLGK